MEKRKEKRPTWKIGFEIYHEHLEDFAKCEDQINELLRNNQDIPANLYLKLFSYLKHSSGLDKKDIEKEVEELTNKVLERFKNTEYDFKVKRLEIDYSKIPFQIPEPESDEIIPHESIPKIYVTYSLDKLLRDVIFKILNNKEAILLKDRCIAYSYHLILDYRDKNIKDKKKKILSDYKIQVLSAYIAQLMGFGIITKSNPTNNDLFQAARHAISKLKKQKPQT